MRVVNIIKASGQIEPFSEEKVKSSLGRAGADRETAEEILADIKPHLYDRIPSFEVYDMIMRLLRKKQKTIAERYDLKRAIMQLGPTGYPFEKFVGAVLEADGYKVKLNQILFGKCVSHEVDVEAIMDSEKYMIECKFHNQPGGRTDIKDALYTYARFLDLAPKGFTKAWLMTNTKVSQDVQTYAGCVGMKVTGWDYPDGESLRELVDKSGLHPITAIAGLSFEQKQSLIDKGVVFCKDYDACKREAEALGSGR